MRGIELLAPAGSWEAMVAAVQSGADAVYLGGQAFSARQYASNFNKDQMSRAVEYCHLRAVRLYITLNILVHQRELEEAARYVSFLCKIGVDGIIVQDIGMAKFIAEQFPDIPLHGSTQMTIHNLDGVSLLKKIGFNRVVLARELSLEEIHHISENCDIALESFVHGALCVSYSGQCLMSSMIGGRSGNRGKCAQPCRLPYELMLDRKDGLSLRKGYLLSPKDLCTIMFLDEICNAGISSLKIEGRMKRPEYVSVVVGRYRKALDYLAGKREHAVSREDMDELLKIFHRGGFTSGYYYGVNDVQLMSHERPNHGGVYVGKVIGVNSKGERAKVSLEKTLHVGDGVEFRNQGGESGGLTVSFIEKEGRRVSSAGGNEKVTIPASKRTQPGDGVYKTTDIQQIEEAEKYYKDENRSMIPLGGSIHLVVGQPVQFAIWDEEGNYANAITEQSVEAARSKPLTDDEISQQVKKMGGTPFYLKGLAIFKDENAWIPLKALNEARRHALSEISDKRLDQHNPAYHCSNEENISKYFAENEAIRDKRVLGGNEQKKKLAVQAGRLENIAVSLEKGADIILFSPDLYSEEIFSEFAFFLNHKDRMGKEFLLCLPPIVKDKDMEFLRKVLPRYADIFDGIMLGNIGSLQLGKDFFGSAVFGDFNLNVMNALSAKRLAELGVKRITLSLELTLNEIRDIISMSNSKYELVIHGRIPLMNLAHCPVKASGQCNEKQGDCVNCSWNEHVFLRDRMGLDFPIRRIKMQSCLNQILNSQIFCTAKELCKFRNENIEVFRIILSRESSDETGRIVQLYRSLLDGNEWTEDMENIFHDLKMKGITTGHLFRGVT